MLLLFILPPLKPPTNYLYFCKDSLTLMTIKQFASTLGDVKEKVLVASNMKVDLKKAITSGQYIYDYKLNKAKYLTDRIKKSASELVTHSERLAKQNKNSRLDKLLKAAMVNSKFILEQYLEPNKVLPIIEQIERDLKEIEKVEVLEKEISDFEKEAAAIQVPKAKDVPHAHATSLSKPCSVVEPLRA